MTVDGKPLDPRRDLMDHGAAEFAWAQIGGGAKQLALAILAHHAGDEVALRTHLQFESSVVTGLPAQKWTLFGADVDTALAVIESQPHRRATTRSKTRPAQRAPYVPIDAPEPSQAPSARRPTRS